MAVFQKGQPDFKNNMDTLISATLLGFKTYNREFIFVYSNFNDKYYSFLYA